MKEELIIKNLTFADLPQMRELFNEARKKNVSLSFFRKKYAVNLEKFDFLGCGLFKDNKLVGMCPFTLYNLSNGVQTFTFGQIGDLAIQADFRGKGWFSKLRSELETHARTFNLDALITFPNKTAEPVFSGKRQWVNLGTFVVLTYTISTVPFLKLLNKLSVPSMFYNWADLFFSKRSESKWDIQPGLNYIEVVRDKNYFEYKTYGTYRSLQSPYGEVLWSLSDGILVNSTDAKNLVDFENEKNYLIKLFSKLGAHQIAYIFHSRAPLCEAMNFNESQEYLPIFCFIINPEIDPVKILLTGFDRNAF